MTDITIRWAGPSTATASSTYKIRRSLNNVDWTTLAAAQAATTPYASPHSTLSGNVSHGATSIALVDGTSFSTSGYGILDDASIQWTGKSTNTLTGVTWNTGGGTYLLGSDVYEAHEEYADTGVSITLNAVLYEITHIDGDGLLSQPNFFWFLSPPISDARSCTVIVLIAADLGFELRSGVTVTCKLASDEEFSFSGSHLDSDTSTVKSVVTNAFGMAFFACQKDEYRKTTGASLAQYTFTLDSGGAGEKTFTTTEIPDKPFAFLSDIT